jgi:hypothetical protein
MAVSAALAFFSLRLLRTMGAPACITPRLTILDRIVHYIEDEKGFASAEMM